MDVGLNLKVFVKRERDVLREVPRGLRPRREYEQREGLWGLKSLLSLNFLRKACWCWLKEDRNMEGRFGCKVVVQRKVSGVAEYSVEEDFVSKDTLQRE